MAEKRLLDRSEILGLADTLSGKAHYLASDSHDALDLCDRGNGIVGRGGGHGLDHHRIVATNSNVPHMDRPCGTTFPVMS